MPDRFSRLSDDELEAALAKARKATAKPPHLVKQREKVLLEDLLMERIFRRGVDPEDPDEDEISQSLSENARRLIVAHLKPKEIHAQLVDMGFHGGLAERAMDEIRVGFRNSALKRMAVHFLLIAGSAALLSYWFLHQRPGPGEDRLIVLAKGLPTLVALVGFFGFLNALGIYLKMAARHKLR